MKILKKTIRFFEFFNNFALANTTIMPSLSFNFKDKDIFERQFGDFYQPLCRFASRFLKDEVDCEDLVQDVFVKMLDKDLSFEDEQHARHYLYMTVYHDCVSWLRKREHQEHERLDHPNTVQLKAKEEVDIEIMRAEILGKIQHAIESLSEGQRLAFVRSYMEGKKNEEIAEEMQVSVNTVKVHKQRAKIKLRAELKDLYPMIALLMI